MPRRNRTAFTVIELLVVVSIIAMLFGILLPAITKTRTAARVGVSRSNLRQLGVAHKTYAADWADRHVTYTRDNRRSRRRRRVGLRSPDLRDQRRF